VFTSRTAKSPRSSHRGKPNIKFESRSAQTARTVPGIAGQSAGGHGFSLSAPRFTRPQPPPARRSRITALDSRRRLLSGLGLWVSSPCVPSFPHSLNYRGTSEIYSHTETRGGARGGVGARNHRYGREGAVTLHMRCPALPPANLPPDTPHHSAIPILKKETVKRQISGCQLSRGNVTFQSSFSRHKSPVTGLPLPVLPESL
jgi:hypothetical protein